MKKYKVQTFYYNGNTVKYRITEKAVRTYQTITGKRVADITAHEDIYCLLYLCAKNELTGITCTQFVKDGCIGMVIFRARKGEYKPYEIARLFKSFAKNHKL